MIEPASTSLGTPLAAALLALIVCSAGAATPELVVPVEDMEALGPFASWSSAETYGARHDGIADDTAALQRALDEAVKSESARVIRLPAGTYRITRSLRIDATASTYGLALIGDDPLTTQIVWDGPPGGAMLIANGGFFSRFARITWDGRSRAGYGVAHWWKASGPLHGGSPEHADEVFKDMDIGIQGGRQGADYGQLDSEGQVRRVTFLRNRRAGLNVGSFNALDWWVWDSHFIDCARGVSNLFTVGDAHEAVGAGNFMVYRSLFERSKVADVNIANTGWFSVHDSVSIGSRRFFQSEELGANVAAEILQNNRVIDTTDPVAIRNGNLGPLILIDNQFRSAIASPGPVVELGDWTPERDLVSIGNRFTVPGALRRRDGSDRVVSIGDTVVARADIPTPVSPWPRTPRRQVRQVFEVRRGAGAAGLQGAIAAAAAAAARGADNPVVHLPTGTYSIDRPLVLPASVRFQLAGDSVGSVLRWVGNAGAGPMLRLMGPSKATIRDLRLIGEGQTGIELVGADQAAGRVFIVGSLLGPVRSEGLAHTRLAMQANTGIASLTLSSSMSVTSIGAGGIGPVTLLQASRLLMSDTWYEGRDATLFKLDSGDFTYLGGHVGPADPTHGGGPDAPLLLLDGFDGTAAFVGMSLNLPAAGQAIRIGSEVASTHALFLGLSADVADFFQRRAPTVGAIGLMMSKYRTNDRRLASAANAGRSDDAFMLASLRQARSVVWQATAEVAPVEATDVRIYRVMDPDTRVGLDIFGRAR